MQNSGYIFAAYTVIWLGVLGLVVGMVNRQAKLKKEIERTKEMVKARSQ
jgi:CcmD family protein